MRAKQHFLQREFTSEQVLDELKNSLHSTKINDIKQNPNTQRIIVSAAYYNYELTVRGNQLTITPKMDQKFIIILIACAITGFLFLLPFLAVIAIVVLANMEGKEVTAQILQTLTMAKPEQALNQ